MVAMPRRIAASVRFPNPEDELWGMVGRPEAVAGHRVGRDHRAPRSPGRDGDAVGARRQRCKTAWKPAARPLSSSARDVFGERGDQRLALARVQGAHSAQVPVIAA